MSMRMWSEEGIGIKIDNLLHLSPINIEDCLYPSDGSSIFDSIGEYILSYDKSNALECFTDPDGNTYVYYPRRYPWEMRDNDPNSIETTHELIKNVLSESLRISEKQVEEFIDDELFVECYG